jgi:Fic family protein
MYPPFTLTPKILSLVAQISQCLGILEGFRAQVPQPKLRKQNRIRTIHGSLAIEGNTLNLDQVTALFEHKRVLGPKREIIEVRNAIQLYDTWEQLKPSSKKDMLKAHAILMKDLVSGLGKFRTESVGILKGSKVSHIAPPANRVPELIENLLEFLKTEKELSPLVKACIFHYEFEFIHPFMDGNGRMGRFWQYVILSNFHPVFIYTPVESIIKQRQTLYYEALGKSDKQGESTYFIEFSLETLYDSLKEFLDSTLPEVQTPFSRLKIAEETFGKEEFARKDYMRLFKTLSTATASRDLALGLTKNLLRRNGARALSKYQF